MRISTRTKPRIGEVRRRRRKKQPDTQTELRVEWLRWLIEVYGPDAVADWQEPPVTFEEWRKVRELAAHGCEAA